MRDAVGASHGNIERLRELVEKQPALARASVDWGFGDWETCIDAASHVGNRPIAEYLLSNGARPTIFSAAMMGQLEVVKAFIAARPGIQKKHGPHGITLMSHAKAGGADAVVQYLAALGDADVPTPVQPLDEASRDALLGTYVYGPGPRDYLAVDLSSDRKRLQIDRPGGPGRHNIMHSGDLVFFPVGVPSAKITFARENGRITQLTLADPNVLITAKRRT